jgi:acyl-CoA thioesterase
MTAAGDTGWAGEIRRGWDILGNANGGYLLGLAGRAMFAATDRPDVGSITAHYLRPGIPGPVSADVEIVKTGKRFTTARCTLSAKAPILSVLGSFTDHDFAHDDRTVLLEPMPEFPSPDECLHIEGGDGFPPPIMNKVDLRLHPDDNFYAHPTGSMLIRGWVRLLDDEPWDSIGLLLAADVFPPAVFNADVDMGWVPTLELTVHVRHRPAPGWLRCHFSTRFITGGFAEEDGLIWDSTGRLVAQSRQLALLPR